jgi:hypothetical protein
MEGWRAYTMDYKGLRSVTAIIGAAEMAALSKARPSSMQQLREQVSMAESKYAYGDEILQVGATGRGKGGGEGGAAIAAWRGAALAAWRRLRCAAPGCWGGGGQVRLPRPLLGLALAPGAGALSAAAQA